MNRAPSELLCRPAARNRGAGLLALLLAGLLPGQVGWLDRSKATVAGRFASAMAYDSARGRTVLFGGQGSDYKALGDTWECDGSSWTRMAPVTSPPARALHAMAYDAARGRVVLFGGGGVPNDTWEWDGTNWLQRNPATPPPPRATHAMAFDSARGRVVMFGGTGSTDLSDTWEWDGSNWSERFPTTRPSARFGHALAYDPVRGQVLMFGGIAFSVYLADTWVWDGSTWSQLASSVNPPRVYHAMAADPARGRIVLFGGRSPSSSTGLLSDTWEWDGSTWSQRTPAVSPAARYYHAMAYAPGNRVMLFGAPDLQDDTWEWDGTAWKLRLPPTRPTTAGSAVMIYDSARGRSVMLAPHDDTWEWDGVDWSLRNATPGPGERYDHGMAYDSVRRCAVLFGGYRRGASVLADTWEYDGVLWNARSPSTAPSARVTPGMAYDPVRKVTVLFGGNPVGNPPLTDTWEWDGSTWTQRFPSASPTLAGPLVYDSVRGKVLLCTGHVRNALNPFQLWEWDGTTWTMLFATGSVPDARLGFGFAYDAARGRAVVYGGQINIPPPPVWSIITVGDTFEWDGTTWTAGQLGLKRKNHGMTFDSARGRIVIFGGVSFGQLTDTWEYGPASPAAFIPFGSGCPTSIGVPLLGAAMGSLPWLGKLFTARVDSLSSNPTQDLPVLLLGDSKSSWGSIPLPLDLTPIGMPNCSLFTNPLVTIALTNTGGTATWSVPIPNVPGYAGLSLYAQTLVASPGANALGAVMSNACTMTLGPK